MENEIKLKKCPTCKESKSLDSFSTHKRTKDGKYYQCKDCYKLYIKSERYKKYHKEYQKTEKRKEYIEKYTKANTFLEYQREFNKRPHVAAKRRIRNKKQKLNLIPSYLKAKLKQKGFTNEQITNNPELIEVQKLIIKTKRLCKTSQN
jgi:hypothetical protein